MDAVVTKSGPPHVVIIGGGFGGLTAAKALESAPVRITLLDRANHHLFQPLLYQVAMAGLSPADIAAPIRSVLRQQKNATVLLGEARSVDVSQKKVLLDHGGELTYDFLIVAVGAQNHYFGHDDWARYAIGLKDLDDAVEVRRRVLVAFEAAERAQDPEEHKRLLTFAVVGGGPTGVELAGALAELARFVLARDFRRVDPTAARVVLIEGGPRILGTFPEALSQRAVNDLKRLGAEVRCGTHVSRIDERGVQVGDDLIPTATVLWAAGVRAAPLAATLGAPVDRSSRILVEPDLSLPGRPEVFAIGDAAVFLHQDGKPLPGVSPVAMQQARHVAQSITATLAGRPRTPFRYVDKGNMATIGRAAAIVHIKRLQLSGFLAWLFWLLVHIFFLITFRNRIAVLFNWAYSYFTYKRGARLITGHRLNAGPASLSSLELRPLPPPAATPTPTPAATPTPTGPQG